MMNHKPDHSNYPDSLLGAMTTRWLGRPVHYYPTVASTNDLLFGMAEQGAPAGTLVVTDYQEQGKGRLGRRWLAPAGTSLLFSLLFRPDWPPEKAAWLTMLAGVAAVEAVESVTGLSPQLKWPNDLVILSGDRWQKFGGMLLEGNIVDGRLAASILGIGINVNIASEQMPATGSPVTSLLEESGQHIRRAPLFSEILVRLESGYEAAQRGLSPRAGWENRLVTLKKTVTVTWLEDSQAIVGTAEGTDEWGRLVIRDGSGRQHAVSAGDVTLQVDNSGE